VTYFEDLSEYSYSEQDILSLADAYLLFRPRYRRLNVGWLDAPHPFPTGAAPDWLAPRLLEIAAGPQVNVMRGFHLCTHCGDRATRDMLTVDGVPLGHAEIRVPAEPGLMFAAPTLVWHYVAAHDYLPPGAFVDALEIYDPGWPDSTWIPPDADREAY
jgi:hypothetical protein